MELSVLDLTIEEIHERLVKGEVKVSDLVKEAIERVKKDDCNALEALNFEEALAQAYELDKEKVEEDNLLFGIPYVLKDNFSTRNLETTGGSNILNGYVPLYNATVKNLLDSKKAIMVAKTTLDELAMGGSGKSGHKGTQLNPYDKTRLIGGSSSGSAVMVSSSVVPFSIGSDTGDSVRKPASNGGLVGFKPTYGLISRFGLFPFAVSLDHVAYFTRSVSDASFIFDTLNKYDENDFTSVRKERVKTYPLEENKDHKKVFVIKEIIDSIKDKDILARFDEIVKRIKEKGYQVDYISFDSKILKAIYPSYIIISSSEATSNNANLDGIKFGNRKEGSSYQEVMFNTRNEGFSELIKRRFILGSYALMKENQEEIYLKAKRIRRLIVEKFNKLFEEYDCFIAPSSPTVAPLIENLSDTLDDTYLIADNYLAIGNFGGYPSITIPLGIKEDLPFGLSLTSGQFKDKEVLEIAKDFEDVTHLKNLSIKTLKSKKEEM